MSYDIYLTHPVTGETLEVDVPHFLTGGTYQVGGTLRLWLNITYNYAPYFERVLGEGGIRSLYGKTAAETLPLLQVAVGALEGEADADYWAATEGNAKTALLHLMALADLEPQGVWRGD